MDEAKNMALLFFMDHLMQKNGKRTIHDLSCQFGARGFTQEMRDAVGATQEGLTEFLAQHPSLFTIEGDQVTLKGFGEMDGKKHLMKMPLSGRQRDYTAEAVEFFVAKLEKFGPELQIKSLLGHRSQAAPEIRLVSGRHLREFHEFLELQTNYFIVEGDRVRLANMPEPKIEDESEILDDEGRPLAGVKAKQAAVDFLKSILEQNEDIQIPLENFYKRFCERFPHYVRQDVATNPKELLQFLKLNRNIFFIRSNKVSLVRNKDDGNGSESGRSTASFESTSSTQTSNAQNTESILFPLNYENLHRVHMIKNLKAAKEIVNEFVNDLNNTKCIKNFFDKKILCVEFKLISLGYNHNHNNSTNVENYISIICLSSQNRIAIFDLIHNNNILLESGLKELLENSTILKVTHDVKRVATLLVQRYSVNMQNVFDTQIAHLIIQHEKFNKPLNELHAISFINLQRVYYPQSLMMSNIAPRKLSQTPNWIQRPITDELLLLAVSECHSLITALYRNICLRLPSTHLSLFNLKCSEALKPMLTKSMLNISHNTITHDNQNNINHSMHNLKLNNLHAFSSSNLQKNNNHDLVFNGIYRPPARRKILTSTNENFLTSTNQALLNNTKSISVSNNNTNFKNLSNKTSETSLSLSNPILNNNYIQKNSNDCICLCNCKQNLEKKKLTKMVNSFTQTISTGEITALNIYYD